jgi:hypothetical protein
MSVASRVSTTTVMNQQADIANRVSALRTALNTNTFSIVKASFYQDLINLLAVVGRHTHNYTDYYFVAVGNVYPIGTTIYSGTTSTLLSSSGDLLFSGWSGSSWGATGYGTVGLEMSWMNLRAWWNSYTYGAWITCNTTTGTFSGTSTASYTVIGSGNTLYFSGGSGAVTFNPTTKTFSGASTHSDGYNTVYMETSGSLFRWRITGLFNVTGAWVTLT